MIVTLGLWEGHAIIGRHNYDLHYARMDTHTYFGMSYWVFGTCTERWGFDDSWIRLAWCKYCGQGIKHTNNDPTPHTHPFSPTTRGMQCEQWRCHLVLCVALWLDSSVTLTGTVGLGDRRCDSGLSVCSRCCQNPLPPLGHCCLLAFHYTNPSTHTQLTSASAAPGYRH